MSERDDDRVYDALVIGAGLSGLYAAKRLRDAGLDVRVLEARDRVGGRTLSRALGADTIDLGGQWVGPAQTDALRLCDALGVKTFEQHHEGDKVLDLAGRVRTYRGDVPRASLLALIEAQATIWRLEAMARRVPVHAPWRTRDAEALDATSLEGWMRRHVRTRDARALLAIATRAIFAVEPSELSFLHFLFYLRSGGGLMALAQVKGGAQERRLVGGAQQLSLELAKPLGDALTLSSPVLAIEQGEAEARVTSARGVVRARRVIVAIPPTLVDRLDARLPAARAQLAARMPMGSAIKCIAVYERPFWRERGLSGEAVSDVGPIQLAFDDCAHDATQAALVAFYLGRAAREASDLVPDARRARTLASLVRFFGPEAAHPTHYIDQDWCAERYSGGCYVGVMPPGVMTTVGHTLRAPCGLLHWAGTETAIEHNGYLDGAITAGRRAADEVLAALG